MGPERAREESPETPGADEETVAMRARVHQVRFERRGGASGFCPRHDEFRTYEDDGLGIPQMGPQSGRIRPHEFRPEFISREGPVCDRCLVEGLRLGSMDVTNLEELRSLRIKTTAHEDVLDAADHWGEEALDIVLRALECASRTGRLGELAVHLDSLTSAEVQ
jgi:hypothetical protein